MAIKNLKVTVMLAEDRYSVLAKQAEKKGVSINTYCRLLLSQIASEQSE